MRFAILSDIHGNCVALDAVLADIEANVDGNVDEFWDSGRHGGCRRAAAGVMARLNGLPNTRFVRGNSERYLTTGARPLVTPVEELTTCRCCPPMWVCWNPLPGRPAALAASGHLPFLLDLPLEQRLTLPDGSRVLLAHASPGKDDGDGFLPRYSDEEMSERLDGCDAALLFVGHTQLAQNFHLNGVNVVNPGSIGNPLIPSLRATHAVLEADASGYRVQHRAVDYDRKLAERKAWEVPPSAGGVHQQLSARGSGAPLGRAGRPAVSNQPEQFRYAYSSIFQDESVVRAYQYRPQYPASTFDLLADLLPAT